MKKVYETPKAVKYVFNYMENVAASLGATDGPPNEHANPNAGNSCVTHNTANVVTTPSCAANSNPKPHGNGNGHGHGHQP